MFTAEDRALKTIEKGTTAWEKTKESLKGAISTLKEVITKKHEEIKILEERKNMLANEVIKTENFIRNTDKLYSGNF